MEVARSRDERGREKWSIKMMGEKTGATATKRPRGTFQRKLEAGELQLSCA